MAVHAAPDLKNHAENLFEGFENLMPFRVHDILLVSSLYDSFILREDGRLNELLMKESLDLHLQNVPGISHVSSGREALELARSQPRFNLIVTNLQVGDMNAAELAAKVKQAGLDVPVLPWPTIIARSRTLSLAGHEPTSSASSSGKATAASSYRWSSTSRTSETCSMTPKR